jgi:hypothetical protein
MAIWLFCGYFWFLNQFLHFITLKLKKLINLKI